MPADDSAVVAAYLQHLSDSDVVVLAGRGGDGADVHQVRAQLRARRGGIEDLLGRPEAVDAVFGRSGEDDPLVGVSPFLLFAVAVHQTFRGLESASYVPDWAGVGRRTPVFDAVRLRQFASSPWLRLFLAELLASFTHVSSGSVLVPTRRGLRRQRFSELDPVRLAGLLEVVSAAERPGVLRRMGDVALFLTGVFPDHVARRGFGPIEEARLARAGGLGRSRRDSGAVLGRNRALPGDDSAVALLEQLGRRWYGASVEMIPRPLPASVAVVGDVSDHFGDARRILALVSERYLFHYRDRWFGTGGD